MKAYHGTGYTGLLSGRVWATLDRGYAEEYARRAGPCGHIRTLDLSGLRVLDLSHLGICPDLPDLVRALSAAGVDLEDTRLYADCEMHQHLTETDLPIDIEIAGYDGVQIREHTAGVGATHSVLIFDI